ncbi:NAD(P)/FAD-dependent oxidoreductase [Chitinispirillales bacterium ANBcel5]|uniref:phytoene desaturase family protein n=1 Tax=Cellulosispirillum alkaliphilum TaxID=3039283 RepID=UPI002A54A68F|nr:NAD(P)/FAD-dependent oxidoreductase [Chitinispirillales bacterium ANBcel5]
MSPNENQSKKVIIIGAGIAGLSVASYLRQNGYETEIYEKHSCAGGLCTAWKRKGYTIDYCIHWLYGSKPGTSFHTLYNELGALSGPEGKQVEIVDFEIFGTIELSNGDSFTLYSDIALLQKEMLRIAPEDRKKINSLCKDIRKISKFDFAQATEQWGLSGWLKYIYTQAPRVPTILKRINTKVEDVVSTIKSPLLKEVLLTRVPAEWSIFALIFSLSAQIGRNGGYPKGGSLSLVNNMTNRYLSLGGKIYYNAPVSTVVTKNDRASGVILNDGKEIHGDHIISAADGHYTLFTMLNGDFLPDTLKKAYSQYPLFPSTLFIALGVRNDLLDLPHAVSMILKEPIEVDDGSVIDRLSVRVFNFDPSLSPPGKCLVTVTAYTGNDLYWENLKEQSVKRYEKQKKAIAERVIEELDVRFKNISDAIEMVDVSTPHTVKRYTGNWHGSMEGFAPTPASLSKSLPKTLPGLKNFYMTGQWTTPGGGIPPAVSSGRSVCIKICKSDGKKPRFSTS